MDQKTCRSCAYFLQHYILNERKLVRIYCGHCTHGKPITKRPTAKSCPHYIEAPPDEAAFASKEYLSKAFLEYALKLDLLPEIYDVRELVDCDISKEVT